MNALDFTFDESPWELTLASLRPNGTIDASRFLAALEGEDEETVERAFADLQERMIALDVSNLPTQELGSALGTRLRLEQQLVREGTLRQSLEPNDPLRLYLDEISRIPAPMIEPWVLAQRVLSGDENARTHLANMCLWRVVEAAYALTGKGVLLQDLIQDGSLGLWQSILNYTGGDFEAHADWWIHQAMARTIVLQARANGVGSMLRRAMENYRAADKALLSELGRNPTVEQIAAFLHKSPEDVAAIEKMLRDAEAVARAESVEQPDPDADKAVEDTAYFQSRQRILELLACLDDQDAKILSLRFGLEGGLPLTPQQTAAKLGMTPDEVETREAKALDLLRNTHD